METFKAQPKQVIQGMSMPRVLLGVEGAALLGASLALYAYFGYNWWLFALLLLAPDIAMLGYLRGPVLGSAMYNAAHTYTLPILLAVAGFVADAPLALQFALIWLAHIGMDRAVGYGFKYATGFKDTHMGRV